MVNKIVDQLSQESMEDIKVLSFLTSGYCVRERSIELRDQQISFQGRLTQTLIDPFITEHRECALVPSLSVLRDKSAQETARGSSKRS